MAEKSQDKDLIVFLQLVFSFNEQMLLAYYNVMYDSSMTNIFHSVFTALYIPPFNSQLHFTRKQKNTHTSICCIKVCLLIKCEHIRCLFGSWHTAPYFSMHSNDFMLLESSLFLTRVQFQKCVVHQLDLLELLLLISTLNVQRVKSLIFEIGNKENISI